MTDYIIKKDVPILDEHVLYDEKGERLATINEARLKKIASLANARIKETGDECPIIIGHTKDNAEEEDQPEIVGYASNFKVSRFFKTGRKAITATFRFFKRYAAKIKKYPRRSIELWLNDWKIDPISLLGATTPERDLGLLKFQKNGDRKYRIIYKAKLKEKVPMHDEHSEIVDAVMKALEESAPWKWICEKMKEEGVPEDGEQTPGEEMEDTDEGMREMQPGEDEELGDEEEAGDDLEADPEAEEGEEPMRYGMGSVPVGNNTYTPSTGKYMKREPKTTKSAQALMTHKMSKDQTRTKLHRFEKALNQLAKENTHLKKLYRKEQREKDLIQLESEGLDFDRAEELEDIVDLPEEKYQRHLDKMRRRYSKAPIYDGSGSSPFSYSRGQGGSLSRKVITDQAVALAESEGISFSQALERIEG